LAIIEEFYYLNQQKKRLLDKHETGSSTEIEALNKLLRFLQQKAKEMKIDFRSKPSVEEGTLPQNAPLSGQSYVSPVSSPNFNSMGSKSISSNTVGTSSGAVFNVQSSPMLPLSPLKSSRSIEFLRRRSISEKLFSVKVSDTFSKSIPTETDNEILTQSMSTSDVKDLAKRLFSHKEKRQEKAINKLERIVLDDRLRKAFCRAEGISILSKNLDAYMSRLYNEALLLRIVWLLCNLCADESCLKELYACAGFVSLVKLLRSQNENIQLQCLWLLTSLSVDEKHVKDICSFGIMAPLVTILSKKYSNNANDSNELKLHALALVINIAIDEDCAEQFYREHGIDALVSLLSSVPAASINEVHLRAVWAMLNLSASCRAYIDSLSRSAYRILLFLSGLCREAIPKAGGLSALIPFLNIPIGAPQNPSVSVYREEILLRSLCCISNLVIEESNKEKVLISSGVLPLVNCLSVTNIQIQMETAKLIGILGSNEKVRQTFNDTKVVHRLLSLISSPSLEAPVKQHSLWALATLSIDECHQEEVLNLGGIKQIVNALWHPELQESAAWCLSCLALNTKGSREIRECQGIQILAVNLFQKGEERVRVPAAKALVNLSLTDKGNKELIAGLLKEKRADMSNLQAAR